MAATRVGIVGAGWIAKVHLRVLSGFDDVKVVGVSSRSLEAAGRLADPVGARVYPDYRSMLDGAELDAVFVCVPPYAAAEPVLAVVDRGIALFAEKPLGVDDESAGPDREGDPREGHRLVRRLPVAVSRGRRSSPRAARGPPAPAGRRLLARRDARRRVVDSEGSIGRSDRGAGDAHLRPGALSGRRNGAHRRHGRRVPRTGLPRQRHPRRHRDLGAFRVGRHRLVLDDFAAPHHRTGSSSRPFPTALP
jgi:hypothetical protein